MNKIINYKLICQNQCQALTEINNEMSHCKQIYGCADTCEQYSKSSSKRLFQSVFKILDHDELEISSFDQTDTNGSKITKILQNQLFVQALLQKLKTEQLDQLYPILKVRCMNQRRNTLSLDSNDLHDVFSKIGAVYTIYELQSQHNYYMFYTSFSSAYVAMKLLNNFTLRHSIANLSVQWCMSQQYCNFTHILPQYHMKIEWPNSQTLLKRQSSSSSNQSMKQCKYTCRYDIQIENQKDFQVARRIIGSKGINMKKIIQSALDQLGEKINTSNYNTNQILKLRLRGRGSGYKEGPEQIQSEEELHLCISAKDETIYNYACYCVEKLLENVYLQYAQYTKKQGRAINLSIKKSDISIQSNSTQTNNENVMKNIEINLNGRMEPQKIEHFLQLRNKARRQLNFAQADRIRNYLRVCGVCLIDQKGRRGKAAEVTTWKYML